MPSLKRRSHPGPRVSTSGPAGDYSLGLVEAALVGVVLVVPAMANLYASEVFQLNKMVLLRLFVLALAATWIVRSFSRERPNGEGRFAGLVRSLAAMPLAGPLGVLALVYVVATCLSINPAASWGGSYGYLEGTCTLFCQVALFASVVAHLRTFGQVQRLVTAILVGSFPVAVYGILQRAGLDPLVFPTVEGRVISTMGQPLFLADYLSLAIPLTLWRIGSLTAAARATAGPSPVRRVALGFYIVLALLQLAAFAFSDSRGPLIGLAAGLVFLAALWMVTTRQWRGLLLVGAVCMAGGLALVLLNVSNNPSKPSPLLTFLGIQRLGTIAPGPKGPDAFRAILWPQAAPLMLSPQPLAYPAGGGDALHPLRFWFGYGPETLAQALPPTFARQPEWQNVEDRFHDLTWDLWSSTGLFGVAAFLAFVMALFWRGYRFLGLLESTREKILFVLPPPMLGAAGAAGLAAWHGFGFAGPGFLGGFMAGLLAYPFRGGARRHAPTAPDAPRPGEVSLMMTLLAALAVHLIGLVFAFSCAGADLLFWIYAGIAMALARGLDPAAAPSPKAGAVAIPPGKRHPVLFGATATTLLTVTLLFGFMHLYFFENLSIGGLLFNTLDQIPSRQTDSYLLYLCLLPTLAASAFAFLADDENQPPARAFPATLGKIMLIALLAGGAYALIEATLIATIGAVPRQFAPASDALAQDTGYQTLFAIFLGVIAVLVGLAAASLAPPGPAAKNRSARPATWVGIALVAAATVTAAWFLGLSIIFADISAGWSRALVSLNRAQLSVPVYRRAVEERPGSLVYRRLLAQALADQVQSGSSDQSPADTLKEAETNLREAQRLSTGLDLCDHQLGRLYLLWLTVDPNPDEQRALAQKADQALAEALVYQPGLGSILNERAALASLRLLPPSETKNAP